jgi:DNA-directed RNA polymerase I subunit RPA2
MYAGPLRAVFRVQIGGQSMRFEKSLGDLPIMVGSKRCRLAGRSIEELVGLREEATEVGGYFIVNGIERIIRLLQVRSVPGACVLQ